MQRSWKILLSAVSALVLLSAYAGAAFGLAGNVQFVVGDVKLITRTGETRALLKGAEVNEGDRIVSAVDGSAQIRMIDGGLIAIRPSTEMGFDTYRYGGKEDGSESAVLSLLRGGFRTITGIIGRTNKRNYLIHTETATIGIRGTDHEPMVILPPALGQVAIAPAGTYDKVNVGVAYIRTDAGSVDIQPNQVGFAPVTKAAPVILPKIPPFYKPTPAPEAQKAKAEAKDEGKKEAATAEIRDKAVGDPKAAAAAEAPAAAPTQTAPVVALTATDASGLTVNATTQTLTTSTGTTTSITPGVTPPPPTPTVGNPAVAAGSYGYGIAGAVPVTGGVELVSLGAQTGAATAAATNFVLNNNNLVELLQSPYQRVGLASQVLVANADVKFTGGTAADAHSDPNGSYYMGRWTGGQIAVTDLATTNPTAPFADSLGAASVHWLVGLLPGNVAGTSTNNVQQLVGSANYALAAATHPTDGLGNVGTLNSATLTADFSAQTVDSSLNLSFSSADQANPSKRNLSLTASATKMPIQQASFGAAAISATVAGVPTNTGINNTISCSGADCAPGGYAGSIGGAFLAAASGGSSSGAVGTGVGMNYGFIAIPSGTSAASQPFSEYISGAAVLSTSAPPSVGTSPFASGVGLRDELLWPTTQVLAGTNPAVTTYVVSDKYRENLYNNSSGTPSTPLSTPLTTPVTLTGPNGNSNFVFDASGNLLKVLDTPHVVFDLGNDVPGSSTQFAAPTPLAHAQLTFGGGGMPAESFYDAGTGIRLGRWSGGAVDITDLSTGTSYVESLVAPGGGQRSVQWVVAQAPSSLPITGEFQYVRIADASGTPSFATAPTDSYGNVGTLDGARLSADFTNMRASAGVRISMPSGPGGSFGVQSLSAHFDNAPISSGGFNVSSGSDNPAGTDNLHVACFGAGCAPTLSTGASPYGGRIRGAFDSASGNAGTADGAFLRYTFDTLYGAYGVTPPAGRVVDDYINGLVAFKQGPQIAIPTSAAYPTAAPTAPVVVVANYGYNAGGNNIFDGGRTYWVDRPTTGLVTDAAGNLISVTESSDATHGDGNALTLSGGAASPATPTTFAIGSAATATDGNILLGWQAATPGLTVSGIDGGGSCFGTGCAANPSPRTVLGDGLAWVRGPAPFPDYLPSAIAGYSNSLGVVVAGSATYNLGASILHDQSGATGSVTSAGLTVDFNKSSVAFNMAATTAAGNWTASATSVKMNQSGSFYANTGGPATIVSGSTIAPATTHENLSVTFSGGGSPFGSIQGQLMGIGLGGAGVTYDLNSFAPCTSGPCPVASANGSLAFGLSPAQQPYSTLTANQLVAFTTGMNAAGQYDSSENYRIQGGYVSPYRTQTVNNFPVRIDAELPVAFTASSSCTINCGPFTTSIPAVYAVAGASGAASIGSATLLESGYDLATGIRWGRYGNGTIGVNDRVSGTSLGTLDVSQQNSHFIMTSSQSGPTVLPLTGTFNYAFVGGTSPTDSKGNVGAPLTAANASLTANFSTQKVDAALNNLVVGGNTWSASATGIPIVGNIFQAEKKLGGGGNLTVTSTLGSNTSGTLAGAFTGSTGNGAALLYSLNQGGNSITNPAAVTVSGVAVFKR